MCAVRGDVIENVSAWPGAVHAVVKHHHTLLSDISAVGSLDSLRGVVVIAYGGVHTSHGASPLCDVVCEPE